MELTKISRSKSFEMVNGFGLKLWDKFALEGDLGENENPLDAYNELGKIIDQAHKEANQTLSFVADNVPVPERQIDRPQQSMIEEMEACFTLTDIQSFRFTVKNADEQAVYSRKLEELSPKN